MRRIVVDPGTQLRRTLLQGPSWAAMVATCAAEMFPNAGGGVLLTSGVLASLATCDFRLDLRRRHRTLAR